MHPAVLACVPALHPVTRTLIVETTGVLCCPPLTPWPGPSSRPAPNAGAAPAYLSRLIPVGHPALVPPSPRRKCISDPEPVSRPHRRKLSAGRLLNSVRPVRLSGRVQEPRPEAQTRGHTFLVPSEASFCHRRFILPPACHSAMVAFTEPANLSGREVFRRLTLPVPFALCSFPPPPEACQNHHQPA